jgi:ABC-type amino acid transport substrate-binding protein
MQILQTSFNSVIIKKTNNARKCPIYDIDWCLLSDVLLNLIITLCKIMAETSASGPSSGPTNPSPTQSLQKKKKTPWMIIGIVIVVVVALIAVVVMGGFLNSTESNVLKKVQNRGSLIVGTQIPYEPFEYQNLTTLKYEGIDMELAQKVADALNVTLVIKKMDFDPLFAAVQTGQIDMAISSITITALREKTVNFTVPYYMANQAILVKDTSTIANLNDLNGTKVIAQLGTTGSDLAKKDLVDSGRGVTLTDTTDVAGAATSVQNGQQDAFIVDTPVAYKYANTAANHLKVAFVIQTNENYGICIQKNQDDFRNAINKVINTMKSDGSLDALLHKYNAA